MICIFCLFFKGLTWTASAALYMPSNYRGSLEGVLNTTFDLSTARASLNDLSITESGVSYLIQVSVTTSPASEYGFSQELAAFDVIDPDAVIHTGETVTLTLRFDADYDTVVAGKEASLEIYFLNHIAPLYENVTFSNVVISEGKCTCVYATKCRRGH